MSIPASNSRLRRLRAAPAGFTLVELVLVLVILGALAALLLPRFIDLKRDSVSAATQTLGGAVKQASMNLRLKCATSSNCNLNSGTYQINVNGRNFQIWNGWVDAGDNLGNNEVDQAVVANGFNVSIANPNTRWVHKSAATPATCYVEYREAVSAGSTPVVTVATTGC